MTDDQIPPALGKAEADSFEYALGTRDGQVIRFESVRICGEWVHLEKPIPQIQKPGWLLYYDRGLDIRLADILWVADCPEGS